MITRTLGGAPQIHLKKGQSQQLAPEKWWLEDYFSFENAYFGYVKFPGCSTWKLVLWLADHLVELISGLWVESMVIIIADVCFTEIIQ